MISPLVLEIGTFQPLWALLILHATSLRLDVFTIPSVEMLEEGEDFWCETRGGRRRDRRVRKEIILTAAIHHTLYFSLHIHKEGAITSSVLTYTAS